MSAANICEYKAHTATTLAGIQLKSVVIVINIKGGQSSQGIISIMPFDLILCKDPTCKYPCHIAAIDSMYMQIIDAIRTAEHEVLKDKLTETTSAGTWVEGGLLGATPASSGCFSDVEKE